VYVALLFGQLSRGETNRKFSKLKFFNDLAAAPIFSPSCGLTKNKINIFKEHYKFAGALSLYNL
jgi:hypothetical protein